MRNPPREGGFANGMLRFRRTSVEPNVKYAVLIMVALAGCSGRPPTPVKTVVTEKAPSRPGVDTRGPSSSHADAIAHLLEAPWAARIDRRRTVSLPLPDGAAWTHVKYYGITTLAGYRYGDDHHVALAIFSFAPPKGALATVDGCAKRLWDWGDERAKLYDVEISEPRIDEITWPPTAKTKAKIFVVDARRRSLLGTKRYAAAYAIYPAWQEACLAVGFAGPRAPPPRRRGRCAIAWSATRCPRSR
jgi:hypothetical protein